MATSSASKLLEFTEYIAPDGTVYSFDSLDKFLMSETGLGLPPIEYITTRGPFEHGDTLVDYRLRPRLIQLVHRANACSRQEYWDKRAVLLDAIRPNRHGFGTFNPGTLRKTLPNGDRRAIDVVIEEGPAFAPRQLDRWDEWAFTETLRFVANDPTFYDPTEQSVTWVLSAQENLIFPITFPIVFGANVIDSDQTIAYTGTWDSYPRIAIVGPFNGPTIENLTTNERLHLLYDVSGGETVEIDLAFGNKTITSSTGINLIGTLSDDSNLATFHIAPDPVATGGQNTIKVTGAGALVGTTSVTLYYYTRYIGI